MLDQEGPIWCTGHHYEKYVSMKTRCFISSRPAQEPVIYVAGRPHVLRLESRPLENVEYVQTFSFRLLLLISSRATGVTTSVVEAMEYSFKKDILWEVRQSGGRILLHDEVEERPGVFSIIPIWEVVEEKDIMTPRDVFNSIVAEGYRVCFYSFLPYSTLNETLI